MRNRRVGTFTMGGALILTGICVLLVIFNLLDIVSVLKFAPVILIALGIEILIYSFVAKEEKLKYDGLSIFICFILICGSLVTSAIVPIATKITQTYEVRHDFMESADETAIKALAYDNTIVGIHCFSPDNFDEYNPFSERKIDKSRLKAYCDVTINRNFASKEEFAKTAIEISQRLSEADKRIMLGKMESKDEKFSVHLYSQSQVVYEKVLNMVEYSEEETE